MPPTTATLQLLMQQLGAAAEKVDPAMLSSALDMQMVGAGAQRAHGTVHSRAMSDMRKPVHCNLPNVRSRNPHAIDAAGGEHLFAFQQLCDGFCRRQHVL